MSEKGEFDCTKEEKSPKNVELTSSESEGTIYGAPVNHFIPKPLDKATGSKEKEAETSIVNLSDHTREPTPPLMNKTLEEQLVQGTIKSRTLMFQMLIRSIPYMMRTMIKMRMTIATSWIGVSGVTSVSFLIMPATKLLKRHEQLNRDYIDLCHRSDVHVEALNHLRSDCQRERQVLRIENNAKTVRSMARGSVQARLLAQALEPTFVPAVCHVATYEWRIWNLCAVILGSVPKAPNI
ncbi:hypothetical protein Tco_1339641 [Tanacetum coccineum]